MSWRDHLALRGRPDGISAEVHVLDAARQLPSDGDDRGADGEGEGGAREDDEPAVAALLAVELEVAPLDRLRLVRGQQLALQPAHLHRPDLHRLLEVLAELVRREDVDRSPLLLRVELREPCVDLLHRFELLDRGRQVAVVRRLQRRLELQQAPLLLAPEVDVLPIVPSDPDAGLAVDLPARTITVRLRLNGLGPPFLDRFAAVSNRFSGSWCRLLESWGQDGEGGEKTGGKRRKMGGKWPKESGSNDGLIANAE